jgi:hypothetical protein
MLVYQRVTSMNLKMENGAFNQPKCDEAPQFLKGKSCPTNLLPDKLGANG